MRPTDARGDRFGSPGRTPFTHATPVETRPVATVEPVAEDANCTCHSMPAVEARKVALARNAIQSPSPTPTRVRRDMERQCLGRHLLVRRDVGHVDVDEPHLVGRRLVEPHLVEPYMVERELGQPYLER